MHCPLFFFCKTLAPPPDYRPDIVYLLEEIRPGIKKSLLQHDIFLGIHRQNQLIFFKEIRTSLNFCLWLRSSPFATRRIAVSLEIFRYDSLSMELLPMVLS